MAEDSPPGLVRDELLRVADQWAQLAEHAKARERA
jgi:hypothetical protein